jgi:threonine/homoserine/homoserine lactone efflux protein
VVLVAATGLAVVAQTHAGVITAIKYAGAAYLLYLAWKLWTAPAVPLELSADSGTDEKPWRMFLGGLALTLGNPKPIIFFMAILPTIVDLTTLTPLAMLEIAAVIVVVIHGALGAYALAADRARRLFRDANSLRTLNRTTAVVIAGAAAMVARS